VSLAKAKPPRTTLLAWGLFAACLPLYTLTVSISAVRSFPPWETAIVLLFLVTPGLGALIAARQPRHVIGWLLLALGLGMGLLGVASEYVTLGERESWPALAYVGWFGLMFLPTLLLIGAVLIPLLFPTGRLLSPRWRIGLLPAAGALLFMTVGSAVRPGRLDMSKVEIENPFGIAGAEWVQGLGFFLFFIAVLIALASLTMRFFQSRGDERQQLKWLVFSVALLFPAFVMGEALSTAVDGLRESSDLQWLPFYALLFFGIPGSIGIAILRYRLYDIDRIINRTLTYGLLTATLGAAYLGLVVGLQALLRPINGGSDFAIVVTTLAVAALFLPARRAVQAAVDRRFNRQGYDAARTIEAFGARLREQIDLDTLRDEMLAVIDETMQPVRAGLWLRDSERAGQ
jgi:hypothetical protein